MRQLLNVLGNHRSNNAVVSLGLIFSIDRGRLDVRLGLRIPTPRASTIDGLVLDHEFEACRFGEGAEISVSREERNSTIDAALCDQCVA